MRTLILVVAAVVLGIWSLFCWAVYGLLGFAGTVASANIDLLPFPPEVVYWTVDLLSGTGGAAVWIVWALGAAAIAIVTLILLALLPRRGRMRQWPASDSPYDLAQGPSRPNDVEPAGRPSGEDIVARVLGRSPRR